MRIAINVRWLLPGKLEGTGIYTLRLLEQLLPNLKEHHFLLLWDRSSAQKEMTANHSFLLGPNIDHKVVYPQARHPWLWWCWNDFQVPKVLRSHDIQLYWSPDGLPAKTTVPQWLTIHDLNFEHHPDWVPKRVSRYYQKHMRKGADLAGHLFTVSKWSARDIAQRYGVDPHKISITSNASQSPMCPGKSDFTGPYFCAVGALTPRKNLITLLRGFDQWLKTHPERKNYRLLIAGASHFKDLDFEHEAGEIQHLSSVAFLGRLSTEQLESLYRGATAFCMPSAMEGFGIPVLEAMQCHTPVIASNNSALTELVEGVGTLVPTYDVEQWAQALERGASGQLPDGALGAARAMEFSWEQSARIWLEVFKSHFE
jgi:glycosyltransferase involved in cell wall biosynthesis